MNHQSDTPTEPAYQGWSHAVTSLLGYQWKLWRTPYQIGMEIVESVLTSSMEIRSEESPSEPEKARSKARTESAGLEQLAAERMRQGLPPPREIYALPYRDRMNWSDFPAWARPTDPELFQDCSHEG